MDVDSLWLEKTSSYVILYTMSCKTQGKIVKKKYKNRKLLKNMVTIVCNL